MALLTDATAAHVLIVLVALWRLPGYGDKVLAFLRNLRRYRNGH